MADDQPHRRHIRRTIDLARDAAERGDRPCGSLLVNEGTVLKEDTNRVYTDDDIALHPELSLLRWADRELSSEELAHTTLYTTVEPCSMCATALSMTELDRVVFCVSGERYWTAAAAAGYDVPEDYIPCSEVVDRLGCGTTVIESVLEQQGFDAVKDCLESA